MISFASFDARKRRKIEKNSKWTGNGTDGGSERDNRSSISLRSFSRVIAPDRINFPCRLPFSFAAPLPRPRDLSWRIRDSSTYSLSLSLYFDENIFTVFPRHGFISVSLHILKERFSLFLFFFPIRHNKVKVIIFLIEKEKTGVNEVSLHLFFFLFFFLSLSVIIPLFEKMIARR